MERVLAQVIQSEFTSNANGICGNQSLESNTLLRFLLKSQIWGYLICCCAAGIIKAILALHHKVLHNINVAKPNSKHSTSEDSALYINTDLARNENGHPSVLV